jgi:cytochrome P450
MIDKVDLSLLPGRTGEEESLAAKQNSYGWSLARAKEFGGICKTTVHGVDAVLLTGEAGICAFYDPRYVARQGSKSPAELAFLSDGTTPVVPILDGEAHAARKGALLETMSPSALDRYLPIVDATISRHLQRWESAQELELKTESQRLAFEVVAEVFTGLNPEESMIENYKLISLGLFGIGVEDGLKGRDKMLDWYRAAVAASRKRGVFDAPSSAIDILVNGGKLTDEQIVAETQHLFIGSAGLPILACNLIYFLAMHPAAQDHVGAEARKFSNPPTRAELDENTRNEP